MTDESVELGEDLGDEADGEIGVMEKGGRVQFVTATGTDIHTRSPTPESSENESESATNGGSGPEGEKVKESQQQRNSQEDEESYSFGSDQFDRDTESDGRTEDAHGDQLEVSDDPYVCTNPKIAIDGTTGADLYPESVETNTKPTNDVDYQENVSPAASIDRDSCLSSAVTDKQSQPEQSVVKQDVDDLQKDDLAMQQKDEKQVDENDKDNYTANLEQVGNASAHSASKPPGTQPPADVIKPDSVTVEQREKSRPKSTGARKAAEPQLFMSETDELEEKQKCNDAAFMSWLKNKNKELRKKRKEAFVKPISEEEKEEKRRMCDMAYKSWLVKKAKEDKEKMRNERLQSAEHSQDKSFSIEHSFEVWLQNKVKQRRKEAKKSELEKLEKAKTSRIVDQTISREAYKKWMKKKQEERKDEISRRLLYRKLYFSQEEQLRLSQSRRYAVQ